MFVYRRESSLWTSLVPDGFTNKAAGTYYCEERVFEWIRLNREENIDEPITGESGEAWRDGGCPKLRSISAAGEGKKWGGGGSTKTQAHSEGRVLHPKTDVMISGLKKQNTPCIHVPKTREVLDDCTLFFFLTMFSFSALLRLSLSHHRSLHTFRLPAHKPGASRSRAYRLSSPPPLNIYTRADRTTVIHCYFGPRAPWNNSGRGHIGIFCGSGGCFQSQITLPDRRSRMNSLP